MGKNHRAELLQEAVRVALTSGLTRKQVAADFGVGFSTLSHWIQQDRKNPEKPSMQTDLEREIATGLFTVCSIEWSPAMTT